MNPPAHSPAFLWLAIGVLNLLLTNPVSHADDSAPVITQIRDMRALDDGALKAKPRVRLRGVVLRAWPRKGNFVIQDESDAVFVGNRDASGGVAALPPGVVEGAVVEVESVAIAGRFAPILLLTDADHLRVVGSAPLPAPQPLTADAAVAGLMDARLVTVEGVARRLRMVTRSPYTILQMEMVFDNTRLAVFLDEPDAGWEKLLDARVRVTGISSGVWNREGQIIAPSVLDLTRDDVEVLRSAPPDPFALPILRVADILRFRPDAAPGHRIRIAGTVLHALPDGRVFVLDEGRAVCAECVAPSAAKAGDRVEVVGFPSMRVRAPLLEDAVLRVKDHDAPLPGAVRREPATLLQESKDYELVQVEARLLESRQTQTGADLLLQSGSAVFRAAFDGRGPDPSLAALKPGSELALSGLVLFSFPSPTQQQFRPNGFSLLLRSPEDVRVLFQPPWWTVGRLATLLGATVALVLAFALWNHFLRARARAQQEIISAQARREATADERTRLARELHDTLEQEFVGMTRQTEALEHAGPLTPQAHEKLGVLRQMLQLSRDNARRTVWDLRDPALLYCGLEAAVRAALQRSVVGTGTVVTVQADSELPADLPPQVQINVLRLAQEAVTNAVKHSDARHIDVRLCHDGGRLKLTVSDDGHSSAISPAPAAGHFGIIGMRERCEKLGGRFELSSRNGSGTMMYAEIPV